MADSPNFAKLVPGFDFLQGLAKNAGAAHAQHRPVGRADARPRRARKAHRELRTVQFWLEQNARMLGATIQALEVQRMTLSTLKTMNVQMEDLRDSLQIRMPTATPAAAATPGAGDADAAAAAPAAPGPEPAAARRARGREGAAPARRSAAVVGSADEAVHRTRRRRDEGVGLRCRAEPGRPRRAAPAARRPPAAADGADPPQPAAPSAPRPRKRARKPRAG